MALVIGCSLAMCALLGASVLYTVLRLQMPQQAHPQQIAKAPVFKPVVGDVHDPQDDDPDVTVQQSLIPGFQFKQGGYTLSGTVIDAQTGRPVSGAVVWLDLPVQVGQPTSAALNTVTDAQGYYQFTHIAAGSYSVVSSRYYNVGDGRYYAERVFSAIALNGDRTHSISMPC